MDRVCARNPCIMHHAVLTHAVGCGGEEAKSLYWSVPTCMNYVTTTRPSGRVTWQGVVVGSGCV